MFCSKAVMKVVKIQLWKERRPVDLLQAWQLWNVNVKSCCLQEES